MQDRLIIGTRGSRLALTQTHWVRSQILALNPELDPEQVIVETIVTTGDQITDRKLMDIGGKGLFTKEIEERLSDGRCHIAVHSMKDMPTLLPEGLVLAASPKREDPRDVLISEKAESLAALPEGACLGTASLRRAAQVLSLRPDLKIKMLRGNVNTRIDKLRDGVVDATLLARAGLNRLGMALEDGYPVPVEQMLPAVGQGALALEIREGDENTAQILKPLGDEHTTRAVQAERGFLRTLDGNCRTPLAAYARIENETIILDAKVYSAAGDVCYSASLTGKLAEAEHIGIAAAEQIAERAGPDFLAQLKDHSV